MIVAGLLVRSRAVLDGLKLEAKFKGRVGNSCGRGSTPPGCDKIPPMLCGALLRDKSGLILSISPLEHQLSRLGES